MVTKKRNCYIDFLRGVGVIGIVSIHTAFWSGESYTPSWFRSLTLLVDVPFFFFLSGWGSSYNKGEIAKTVKSLGKIWLKWIYFVSVLALFCFLSQFCSWKLNGIYEIADLLRNYMFIVSFPEFPVIAGSIWFIEPYFCVVFINTVMLTFLKRNVDKYEENTKIYTVLLFVLYAWVMYGHNMLPLNQTMLFYSCFWMLGMLRTEWNINSFKKFIGTLVVLGMLCAVSVYATGIQVTQLQTAKFPPSLVYLFASLIVIVIALYLEKYISNPSQLLVHIGQNAIFYFFAQGVGSSIIYNLVNRLSTVPWFFRFLVLFACNLILTSLLAELLAVTYRMLEKKIKCVVR